MIPTKEREDPDVRLVAPNKILNNNGSCNSNIKACNNKFNLCKAEILSNTKMVYLVSP